MAQEGVILPRAPIIIVDRQWRLGKRHHTTGKPAGRNGKADRLKVRILGDEKNGVLSPSGRPGPNAIARRNVPEKTRKFRFVHSSHNSKDTPSDHPLHCKTTGSVSESKESAGSDERAYLEQTNGFSAHVPPSGSSTAFYGIVDRKYSTVFTELLKYYPTVIGTSFYPLQSKVAFDINPIGSVWLPYAIQDKALLSTITLSSAIQINRLNPKAYTGLLQHLSASAIEAINDRITNQMVTDATIGAVSCLTLIDLNVGNYAQSAIHQSGLLEMIRLRGGIRAIDNPLQMKIYRAALLHAIDTLARPSFPRLRPTLPSLHSIFTTRSDMDQTYLTLLAESGLDLELIDIFLSMRQLSTAIHQAMLTRTIVLRRAYDEDTMTLSHDLLSYSGADHDDDDKPLNKCCKYAGLIYMNILIRQHPFSPPVCTNISREFIIEIQRLDPSTIIVDHVAFWCVYLGVMASSSTPEGPRFRQILSSSIEKLSMKEFEECKRRLQNVCWIDQIHDEAGLEVWNEMWKSTINST